MPSLSLILPCFNEAANIRTAVEGVLQWYSAAGIDGEVIAVNDGSLDTTGSILSSLAAASPRVRVVTHERNRGYGAAVFSGLDAARGEIMGFMDSDGQFDPKDFSLLLPLLDRAPFVTGRRRHRADPFMRKVNAKLFGFLSFVILGIWVRDVNCAMKLWKREIWQTIRPRVATGALVNAEMYFRLQRAGLTYAQVDVGHYPRKFGLQTGAKVSVILRMLRELWRLRMAGG